MKGADRAVCKGELDAYGILLPARHHILIAFYDRASGQKPEQVDKVACFTYDPAAARFRIPRCLEASFRSPGRSERARSRPTGSVSRAGARRSPTAAREPDVPWERRLDARLMLAVGSIQAVKGVEIGPAFENATRLGTEVHDEIVLEDGQLTRWTNRAGGFEGGITTGEPVVVRAAMKPISTTLMPLRSVDLATGQEAPTRYERSDICAVPRASVVGEAMVAIALSGALLEKLGGDSIEEMRPRFAELRRGALDGLEMDKEPWRFR